MMEFITYYIVGGIIFNFAYDLSINFLASHDDNHELLRFTWGERFIVLLTWPVPCSRLIIGIIKTIIKEW